MLKQGIASLSSIYVTVTQNKFRLICQYFTIKEELKIKISHTINSDMPL